MSRAFNQTKTEEKLELLDSIRNSENTAIRMAMKIASGKADYKETQMLDRLIANEIHGMHRNTLEFLNL